MPERQMHIVALSQVYWPDDVSTAQHLTDLCELLSCQGEYVEVITSKHKYEESRIVYPGTEQHHDVSIRRLNDFGFGKRTVLGRLLDFTSFNFLLFFRIVFAKKPDLYLGMTSPPLVSFFGVLVAKLRQVKFCYWTMDLQPELSIRSGLIGERSLMARMLVSIGDKIFRNADKIIVLDKYMKEHVIRRGAKPDAISIVPVWPVMQNRYEGDRLQNPFRLKHGFGNATVIMYSGNHSLVHPLDSILQAAVQLKNNTSVIFAFIGAGIRTRDVTHYKQEHHLDTVIQLPYQPRESIHISLGAADIHVVVMGNDLVGYTHPNKIYGAMFIGKPIIYIGPTPSHVTDILEHVPGNIIVNHGQVDRLVEEIVSLMAKGVSELERIGNANLRYAQEHFSPETLKHHMANEVKEVIWNKE